MRLYTGQVPIIAQDIVRNLLQADALEVLPENQTEVELDVQAVLREYIRTDREISDIAREVSARHGNSSIGREKRKIARERGFGIDDDAPGYIIEQLIETFFHSPFVEEVFFTDNEIRRAVNLILRKHMNVDEELDLEVRDKIKNLKEGSQAWDIEYQRAMAKVKRNKKLE